MFEVTVTTRRAVVGNKELITTRSAGIQVQFTFSEDWDGLSKFAIFRNGDDGQEVPVALPNSNLVTIPPQSCSADYVDETVFVGVYGSDGVGGVIIPTIWVSLGVLRPGAVTTDIITPSQPTPDMWAQILAIANNAAAIADECEENETLRVAAEELRASAESLRATAEQARADAEAQRVTAEQNRASGELARQSQESARAEAEILRAQAETLRQEHETSRVSAETDRASAEQTRQSQESTRASNETARISAEQGRASAESSRVTAETNRVSAESSRASAETSRASAEQSRATAETARASAESSRATAENARVAAEQSRADAEAARVSAETARVTEFAGLRTNFAPEYDSTATYAEGDLVLHEGLMYECNTAIATAEAWTAAHWTQVKMSDEVAELNRQLSDLEDSISDAYDATASYAVGDFCINENTLYRCNTAIPTGGEAWTPAHWDAVQIVDLLGSGGGGDVTDVQINGTSIVNAQGVANIPRATDSTEGAVKVYEGYGVKISNGVLFAANPNLNEIKSGVMYKPPAANQTHQVTFYGLAKAAGDTTQSASANAVGAYTEDAKSAIHTMLNGPVAVSGTTPTIAAKDGITYICGEVATLDITLPASGIFDVIFQSGSTPTVLTATGVTWMNGFDPTALEANTTYEINISNGLGVAAWT